MGIKEYNQKQKKKQTPKEFSWGPLTPLPYLKYSQIIKIIKFSHQRIPPISTAWGTTLPQIFNHYYSTFFSGGNSNKLGCFYLSMKKYTINTWIGITAVLFKNSLKKSYLLEDVSRKINFWVVLSLPGTISHMQSSVLEITLKI